MKRRSYALAKALQLRWGLGEPPGHAVERTVSETLSKAKTMLVGHRSLVVLTISYLETKFAFLVRTTLVKPTL